MTTKKFSTMKFALSKFECHAVSQGQHPKINSVLGAIFLSAANAPSLKNAHLIYIVVSPSQRYREISSFFLQVAKLEGDKPASQSSMELYDPWISGPLRIS